MRALLSPLDGPLKLYVHFVILIFSFFGADVRQRVWRCVVEWFADVNTAGLAVHGGGLGRCMLWTMNTGACC